MKQRKFNRTQANAIAICELIADGFTDAQAAENFGIHISAIRKWIIAQPNTFGALYARAKEARVARYADEIIEISDDGTNDWMDRELESGGIVSVPDHEHINRSKLRVDSRKWLLSKLRPKEFGDKITVDGTVKHEFIGTDSELGAIAFASVGPIIEHEPGGSGDRSVDSSDLQKELLCLLRRIADAVESPASETSQIDYQGATEGSEPTD